MSAAGKDIIKRAIKIVTDATKKNTALPDFPSSGRGNPGEGVFNKTIMKTLTAPDSDLQEMQVIDPARFFGPDVANPFNTTGKRFVPPDSVDPNTNIGRIDTSHTTRDNLNDWQRKFDKQFGNENDTLDRTREKTKPDYKRDLEDLLDRILPGPPDLPGRPKYPGPPPRMPDPGDTDLRKNPRQPSRGGGYPLPRDPRGTPLPKTPGEDQTRLPEGCGAMEAQLRKSFGINVSLCSESISRLGITTERPKTQKNDSRGRHKSQAKKSKGRNMK